MRRPRAWFAAMRPGGQGHRPGQLRGSAVRGWTRWRTKAAKAGRIRATSSPSPPGSTVPSLKRRREWSAARRCAFRSYIVSQAMPEAKRRQGAPRGAPCPSLERGANEAGLARALRGEAKSTTRANARGNDGACLSSERMGQAPRAHAV